MPTQAVIAEHLDLSQPAVSEAMKKLQIDWQTETLDQIRVRYIRHLREVAAARGGASESENLARKRARESELKGNLIEMQIAEKAGQLVPSAGIEKRYIAMIRAARTELLLLPEVVVADIKALHGTEVDPDLIETRVHDALNRLANTDPPSFEDELYPDDAGVGTAA